MTDSAKIERLRWDSFLVYPDFAFLCYICLFFFSLLVSLFNQLLCTIEVQALAFARLLRNLRGKNSSLHTSLLLLPCFGLFFRKFSKPSELSFHSLTHSPSLFFHTIQIQEYTNPIPRLTWLCGEFSSSSCHINPVSPSRRHFTALTPCPWLSSLPCLIPTTHLTIHKRDHVRRTGSCWVQGKSEAWIVRSSLRIKENRDVILTSTKWPIWSWEKRCKEPFFGCAFWSHQQHHSLQFLV